MYVVTVDIEKCEACGDCVDNCPDGMMVMTEENGKQYAMFKGDPDDCIGCLSCEASCEQGAVTVTEL